MKVRTDGACSGRHFLLYFTVLIGVALLHPFKLINAQHFDNDDSTHMWQPEDTDPNDLIVHNSDSVSSYSGSRLKDLDVICGKEFMTVRAEFSAPFSGIVYSKSTYGQNKCVYVKPHSSLTHVTFNVKYDECGTKPDLQGKYFENTIVIQYGTDIIEALDEAKRLRCEWFEAYEKPATFRPAIPVADLDVQEMNFQGDEIDCWMSIQEGKGPWSDEVNRIVTVGQPLSLVVAINDRQAEFDMKVKSCFAHDGQKRPIYLIDDEGCILRHKMISPFKKIRNPKSGQATLISYAQFLAFKFPDSVDVNIQCTVEVCRHGCTSSCPHDQPMLASPSSQSSKRHKNTQRVEMTYNPSHRPQSIPPSSVEDHMKKAIDIASGFVMENSDLLESASSDNKDVTVSTPSPSTSTTNAGNAILDHISQSIRQNQNLQQQGSGEISQPSPINEELNYDLDMTKNPPLRHVAITPPVYETNMFTNPQQVSKAVSLPIQPQPAPVNAFMPPYHAPIMTPGEPIAQVLNIPISPIYQHLPTPAAFQQQAQQTPRPTSGFPFMNPFNNFKLIKNNKNPSFLPQMLTSYFNKNRRAQIVPNDNFQIYHSQGSFQKVGRRRRFAGQQGEIGIKRGFQVVTSLDLNFSPNMSASDPPVLQGIPETIVYGICLSSTHFMYLIAVALALLCAGALSCLIVVCKLEKSKKIIH